MSIDHYKYSKYGKGYEVGECPAEFEGSCGVGARPAEVEASTALVGFVIGLPFFLNGNLAAVLTPVAGSTV